MTYAQVLAPLVWLVLALGVSSYVGERVTARTKRKLIGWPVGVLLFLVMMALGGAILP